MNDWVYFEGEELVITEDAPDHVHDFIDNTGEEYASALLNFHIACVAAGYDTFENAPEPHQWRDLVDKHMDNMIDAVEEGDLETAQEQLKIARSFESTGQRVSEALLGSGE